MLSVSKIHKTVKVSEPLKDWIEKEKELYQNKLENGRIPEGMSFDKWVNIRYSKQMPNKGSEKNFSSENLSGFLSDVVDKTINKDSDNENSGLGPTYNTGVPVKTVAGMNPAVFYSVVGGLAIITGVLIYTKIKK